MADTKKTIQTIVFAEGLTICVLNTLAIFIILTSKSFKLKFNNIITCLLFTSHLCCAAVNIAYTVSRLWLILPDYTTYYFRYTRDAFLGAEVTFTVFLSIDRFLVIRKPFLYDRLNNKHAKMSILLFLVLILTFTVWNFLENTSANLFALSFVLISSVFMMVSNTLLYRSVKRQCLNIASTIVHQSSEQKGKELGKLKRRQLKSLTICALIAATFLLTYLPLVFYACLRALVLIENSNTSIYTNMALGAFGYSNGIWDVLIFLHLNGSAKHRLKVICFSLLCCSSRARKVNNSES